MELSNTNKTKFSRRATQNPRVLQDQFSAQWKAAASTEGPRACACQKLSKEAPMKVAAHHLKFRTSPLSSLSIKNSFSESRLPLFVSDHGCGQQEKWTWKCEIKTQRNVDWKEERVNRCRRRSWGRRGEVWGRAGPLFLLSVGRRRSPCYCCSQDKAERKPVEPAGAGGDDFAGSLCWRQWVFNLFALKKIDNLKKKCCCENLKGD